MKCLTCRHESDQEYCSYTCFLNRPSNEEIGLMKHTKSKDQPLQGVYRRLERGSVRVYIMWDLDPLGPGIWICPTYRDALAYRKICTTLTRPAKLTPERRAQRTR